MLLDDLISHAENERNRLNLPLVTMDKTSGTPVVFRSPAAIFPILPVEVIDNVCQRLTIRDMTSVAQANRALNAVCIRRLYHTIGVEMNPVRLLRCMISLDRSTDLATLVRTFEVNLISHLPTKTYYGLLERILKKMVNLTTLIIELPKRHSPNWVFPMPLSPTIAPEPSTPPSSTSTSQFQSPPIFRLRSFTTSMHCKPPLARFLDSQPDITELTLRGINSDSSNPLFPFITTLFHSISAAAPDNPFISSLNSPPAEFSLLPTSLPKLSHFNAIHAGPSIIREIITSRPVTHMSVPLFPPHTRETLSALSLASKPLTRLSVMSFDPTAPHFLFSELSTKFPYLEALHIVVLMAEVTAPMLLDWGEFLAGFKRLRYITFMAALGGDEEGNNEEAREEIDERKIARIWHSSCPTLKTIILPQGKVWFEGTSADDEGAEGDWKCLNWDEE